MPSQQSAVHPRRGPAPRQHHPQGGDLIISPGGTSNGSYSVSQVPGAVQLNVSRRETAAQLARRFAEGHGVDIWEHDDGAYTLVGAYRRQR